MSTGSDAPKEYADAKGPLEAWYFEVLRASWATPQELKAQFGSASILKNNRVIFCQQIDQYAG